MLDFGTVMVNEIAPPSRALSFTRMRNKNGEQHDEHCDTTHREAANPDLEVKEASWRNQLEKTNARRGKMGSMFQKEE